VVRYLDDHFVLGGIPSLLKKTRATCAPQLLNMSPFHAVGTASLHSRAHQVKSSSLKSE
jgi:hypothetical protein